MGRNYVRLEDDSYEDMVDTMEDVIFLLKDCMVLYDGRWNTNKDEYRLLTVRRPSASTCCVSLVCLWMITVTQHKINN